MMRMLERVLVNWFGAKKNPSTTNRKYEQPLSPSLQANLKELKAAFADSFDFSIREFRIGADKRNAAICFLWEMVDEDLLHESIITQLQQSKGPAGGIEELTRDFISSQSLTFVQNLSGCIESVLRGQTILLVDKQAEACSIETRKFETRAIQEPSFERAVIGPREGFTESLRTNLSMIRRHMRNVNLKVELVRLGTQSETDVAVVYLKNEVDQELVDEVMERLGSFKVTKLLDTSFLEEAAEDHPLSPFPQTIYTERPDKVIGNILEGRIAILVDGSPSATILPAAFWDFFQSPEDYYLRPLLAVFSRVTRLLAAFIATTATAGYVAVATFHYDIIPFGLVTEFASTRAATPFNPVIEALVFELAFELIREASVRLPVSFGQTLGVVGALVLGQVAVQANLAAPILVIVVSISAIGSFAIPNYVQSFTLRVLRFPIILGAAALGGFGIVFVYMFLIIHLASIDSFGTPYLRPIAPLRKRALRDSISRPLKQI